MVYGYSLLRISTGSAFACAPRGNPAGHERNGQESDGRRDERRGVAGLDSNSRDSRSVVNHQAAASPPASPTTTGRKSLTRDERFDLRGPRAKREPDAHFATAQTGDVAHHAVDTDRRQHTCEQAEERKQPHLEPPPRDRPIDRGFHCPHLIDREIRIELSHLLAEQMYRVRRDRRPCERP